VEDSRAKKIFMMLFAVIALSNFILQMDREQQEDLKQLVFHVHEYSLDMYEDVRNNKSGLAPLVRLIKAANKLKDYLYDKSIQDELAQVAWKLATTDWFDVRDTWITEQQIRLLFNLE
jgi:hypothetical protein